MSLITQCAQSNPFTPGFGDVPAVLAGREAIINDMLEAFEGNGSSPDLRSIFTGARGTGKTALLTYLGFRAQQAGWIVADSVAGKGMLDDLLQRAQSSASKLVDTREKPKLKGIGIGQLGSIEWDNPPRPEENWRTKMTRLLDALEQTDTGIVFSVDEIDGSLDEMVQLVSTFQLFVRENRKVALMMAGLPFHVSTLLTGKTTSFLRRAAQHNLDSIPSYEVKEAFRLTVEEGGKTIGPDALEAAATAISGFPFMFQLVGYRSWNASRNSTEITTESVVKGVEIANEELASRVYDATIAELSKGDLDFLGAMNPDGSPTERTTIAERTGKSSNWISAYRRRLLEAGVINEPRPGKYAFALPGFGAYVHQMR